MTMILSKSLRLLAAALALSLFLLPASGCDTSVDLGFDAAFFVGTWNLASVHDQDGERNRTSEVNQVVDDLEATFRADNTFTLVVSYAQATGQPDQTFTGSYAVTPTGQLVLTTSQVALGFNVTVISQNTVELRAPAALVEPILAGSEIDIGLVGTVVLTLARSAAR